MVFKTMDVATVASAGFLLLLGHILRSLRWQLLTAPFVNSRLSHYFISLTAGYTASLLLPFRLGELVRVFLFKRLAQIPFSHSLSSVFIDRLLDVFVIALMFAVGSIFSLGFSFWLAAFILFTILIFFVLSYTGNGILKKFYGAIAGLMNPTLERHLLAAAWANQQIFLHLLKPKPLLMAILLSATMWGAYTLSILSFMALAKEPYLEALLIWESLYGSPLTIHAPLWSLLQSQQQTVIQYIMLSVIPLGLVVSYIVLKPSEFVRQSLHRIVRPMGCNHSHSHHHINLFHRPDDELAFLRQWANNIHPKALMLAHQHNQDIRIVRNLSGGSLATIVLAERNGQRFYRKYAVGDLATRLTAQLEWLRKYQNILPVTAIKALHVHSNFTSFDMPYTPEAYGFFDYIHIHHARDNWALLKMCLESLDKNLHQPSRVTAKPEVPLHYLQEKLVGPLQRTLAAAPQLDLLASYPTLVVNGEELPNVLYHAPKLALNQMAATLDRTNCGDIHGDLTIENIICTPNQPTPYYLIDPLDGHIFQSLYLDYAKPRQSLIGGYEFLLGLNHVKVDKHHISLPFVKSEAYTQLGEKLDKYLIRTFGQRGFQEIQLHTFIYWCRLLPYRAAHQPEALPAYIAVACQLAKQANIYKYTA